MATRRVYKKPPIQEAVFDVRYTDPGQPDFRNLPAFLAHMPAAYSGPVTPVFEAQPVIQTMGAGSTQATNFALNIAGPNLQVWAADRKLMITVGKDRVSSHALGPYCGWENFRPQALEAHKAFSEVFRPASVMRIGIRYVNRVVLPLTDFDIAEYFVGTSTVALRTASISRLLSRIEGQFPASNDQFGITFGSAESAPDTVAFMLDIEAYYASLAQPVQVDAVEDHMDRLRDEERELFEAMITDKARKLFDT
jgi:uncharacterized protein (TIGR04255 family)